MALILPPGATPENLHFSDGSTMREVDSDMYDICKRVKEISPALYIVCVTRPDDQWFLIMENCTDGVARQVKKLRELDERALQELRYMMSVPLSVRVDLAQKEIDAYEKSQQEDSLDELYERMGGSMWKQLEHDGFIESRGVSYRNTGARRRG